MKYYLVSDPHGFYSILRKTLEEAGFFEDTEPHKLVILGDLLDRGSEAKQMEEFLLALMEQDLVIYIRGNHEDLMEIMLDDISDGNLWAMVEGSSYHVRNGTWNTALQLTGYEPSQAYRTPGDFCFRMKQTPYYKKLMPKAVDYFETEHYVFVHGWIPTAVQGDPKAYRLQRSHHYDPNWRNAPDKVWERARWHNGMDLACVHHVLEPNKTIVCGHINTSYGHSRYAHRCTEDGRDAIFTPFEAEGILAIDACTAWTGKMNCVVIED